MAAAGAAVETQQVERQPVLAALAVAAMVKAVEPLEAQFLLLEPQTLAAAAAVARLISGQAGALAS
jgi:hypothetical protein